MSGLVPDLVAVVALLTNGLVAGLFFAFAVAVSPGLRRLDDVALTGAFRAINTAILRPSFLLVFVAAPATAVLLAVLHVIDGSSTSTWAVGAAAASVATFVITVAQRAAERGARAGGRVRPGLGERLATCVRVAVDPVEHRPHADGRLRRPRPRSHRGRGCLTRRAHVLRRAALRRWLARWLPRPLGQHHTAFRTTHRD